MLRTFLIVSTLILIASTQQSSSGKGYRTIIQSSFPIDAPLHFDPNNDERLVLSIVKPSSDVPLKTDGKHKLRIINIDHQLALGKKAKTTDLESVFGKDVSVSARLTGQNESKRSESASESSAIDYGLPRIDLEDDSTLFTSPEKKYDGHLTNSEPTSSRLFVSKIPSVEELLEKGYVLTDIYPLEFASDDSEFEFPTDRFFRLPPNNVDGQLRQPQRQFTSFKSEAKENRTQNNESESLSQSKIGSTDEVDDVTVRPLEVKYNFLPRTNQAEFYLGKKYISKFVRPAISYERPRAKSFDGHIKNEQLAENGKPEINPFVSSKSRSSGEAVVSNTKTEEVPQSEYALPFKAEDKKAFVTTLFGESSDGVNSRLSSSESGSSQNNKNRISSGSESQTSGLLSSRSKKTKFDPKVYPQEIKEYSTPSISNEESVFSSKLGEASEVKGVTSSSSAVSSFEEHSSGNGFSSKFAAKSFDEGIKSSFASSESGIPKSKYEIPYSGKPLGYVAVPKSDRERDRLYFTSLPNLPYETPVGNVAPTFDSGSDPIKSLEDFLKPKQFAIYYKLPSTRSSENLWRFQKPIDRYGVPKSSTGDQPHLFLGLPSHPIPSRELLNAYLKTPSGIYSAPHVQSSSPVSSGSELPAINSGTVPIFFTSPEVNRPNSENSEKVSIIYEPSPGRPATEYGVPPSTIYGTPSSSSDIDIRSAKPIKKPFAEYGLPSFKPPPGSPGHDEHPNIDIRKIPKPSLEYGTPSIAAKLEELRQKSGEKFFEFGVPVLKVPNTRPLSSYEVPVY